MNIERLLLGQGYVPHTLTQIREAGKEKLALTPNYNYFYSSMSNCLVYFYQNAAIRILGSAAQDEKCFIYGLNESGHIPCLVHPRPLYRFNHSTNHAVLRDWMMTRIETMYTGEQLMALIDNGTPISGFEGIKPYDDLKSDN